MLIQCGFREVRRPLFRRPFSWGGDLSRSHIALRSPPSGSLPTRAGYFLTFKPNEIMRLYTRLTVFALALLFLTGCGSSSLTIYPTQDQEEDVEMTTRSGYTFLSSSTGSNTVTVSLRQATDSYLQSYVSITNAEGNAVSITPEDITVTAVSPRERSFPAYAPGEVPGVVARSARSSSKSVLQMDRMNVSSSSVTGAERGRAGSSGSYGSDQESDRSYMDLMLKGQSLSPNNVASGLVYTPFSRNIERFRLEVPVGDNTHVFHFETQMVE